MVDIGGDGIKNVISPLRNEYNRNCLISYLETHFLTQRRQRVFITKISSLIAVYSEKTNWLCEQNAGLNVKEAGGTVLCRVRTCFAFRRMDPSSNKQAHIQSE